MKILKIALFGYAMALAAPAAAQTGRAGPEFVQAVRDKNGGKVTELLEGKPTGLIDARGDDGDTGLIIAIRRRDEDFTGFLLNKGANANLAGKDGEPPLVAAARAGFDTGVEWLLVSGARVDGVNRSGETALIVAVQQRQPTIVRRLLEAGANPDKADSAQGYSARDYAMRDPRARDILKAINDKKPKG
ncbi:MAG: ankyrin repeat domain-containing protein [Pseudomonadota bacterium]